MCNRVLLYTQNFTLGIKDLIDGVEDVAFLLLDRNVEGRTALTFGPSSLDQYDVDKPLWSAGYSRGLPLKYKFGAHACRGLQQARNPRTFRHTLSTYPGDSGSPIFNANNEVIGITTASLTVGFTIGSDGEIIAVRKPFLPNHDVEGLAATGFMTDRVQYLLKSSANVTLAGYFVFGDAKEGDLADFKCLFEAKSSYATLEVFCTGKELDVVRLDCTDIFRELRPGSLGFGLLGLAAVDNQFKLTPWAKGGLRGQQMRDLREVSFTVEDGQEKKIAVQLETFPQYPVQMKHGVDVLFSVKRELPLVMH